MMGKIRLSLVNGRFMKSEHLRETFLQWLPADVIPDPEA